jgi:hypothetical protein
MYRNNTEFAWLSFHGIGFSFVTLLTATSVHQHYNGNAFLRFRGYNVHVNAPE